MFIGDLALLITMLRGTNEKSSRSLSFIQQFLSVLFSTRHHTRCSMLSTQTPWGIFPILQMKKQTRREQYHKANKLSTRIWTGACLAENPKLYWFQLLKLLKKSLPLPAPSTSWPPTFWHVNQTWPCLPLNSEAFCLHLFFWHFLVVFVLSHK